MRVHDYMLSLIYFPEDVTVCGMFEKKLLCASVLYAKKILNKLHSPGSSLALPYRYAGTGYFCVLA